MANLYEDTKRMFLMFIFVALLETYGKSATSRLLKKVHEELDFCFVLKC